jgi:hypothetical protein
VIPVSSQEVCYRNPDTLAYAKHRAGIRSTRYLRFDRDWFLFATAGRHRLFEDERQPATRTRHGGYQAARLCYLLRVQARNVSNGDLFL